MQSGETRFLLMPVTVEHIVDLLKEVKDPEVPVLTIADLGILRGVEVKDDYITITITPTFTGCPAMRTIEEEIRNLLHREGFTNFKVRTVLSPPWSSDWISEEGRKQLKEYGIAPPSQSTTMHLESLLTGVRKPVTCPYCDSTDTSLTSAFGSTACKALHYCNGCQQPFEEFKCH